MQYVISIIIFIQDERGSKKCWKVVFSTHEDFCISLELIFPRLFTKSKQKEVDLLQIHSFIYLHFLKFWFTKCSNEITYKPKVLNTQNMEREKKHNSVLSAQDDFIKAHYIEIEVLSCSVCVPTTESLPLTFRFKNLIMNVNFPWLFFYVCATIFFGTLLI